MAVISRPITKTKIATVTWGIPITDEVNAHSTALAALQPTAWTNVTAFSNGWVNSTPVCAYRKIGDVVYIRGHLVSGSALTTAFTLPAGFRPPVTMEFPCNYYTTGMVASNITVYASGAVNPTLSGSVPISHIFFSTTA